MKEKKTKIFIMDVSPLTDPLLLEKYMTDISEDRQKKVDRLKTFDAKALTLGAELLLIKALKQNYAISQPLVIIKEKQGKPVLRDWPDIHFNLSHSGNYAVCAVGAAPVGVDIQKMDKPNLKLATRFFTAEESAWLFSLPQEQQRQGFYDLWTIKESYMKYTGKGFRLPMNAFTVKISGYYPDEMKIMFECEEKLKPVTLKKYDCMENYALWCCSEHNQFAENLEWVDIKEKTIE